MGQVVTYVCVAAYTRGVVEVHFSSSEAATREIAGKLIGNYQRVLQHGTLLLALSGDLGTGKTTFAKGIGEYLGIERPIRSPGYTLVSEYPVRGGMLFHLDLWRTESEDEARPLLTEEMMRPGNIILIEWAQKIPKLLDELRRRDGLKVVLVQFFHCGENERKIEVSDN